MFKVRLLSRVLLFLAWGILVAGLAPGRSAQAATYVVDTTTDNAGLTACTGAAGDCSLRGAIIAANAAAGADTITVPAGTYNLTIAGGSENASATGDLDITGDLTITGQSSATSIIDGNAIDRVLDLILPTTAGSAINVTLNNLTVRDGFNSGTVTEVLAGGIAIRSVAGSNGTVNLTLNSMIVTNNTASTGGGGGIGITRPGGATADHNITINNSTISNNSASTTSIGNGGGIYCACDLTITNSLISGNSVPNPTTGITGGGGGIYITTNSSNISITNSTISGNTANATGGGILLGLGTGSVALNHVTVTNNIADNDNNGGEGGGLYNNSGSSFTIQNSLVVGNDDKTTAANDDCAVTGGFSITSNGYNAVGSGTGCPSGGTGDTATATAPSALASNGGATQTHAITAGHAAIDRIPNGSSGCDANSDKDQRGVIRADGSGGGSNCDSGAYEADTSEVFQQCSMTLGVNYILSNGVGVTVNTAGTLSCLNATRTGSNHPNATAGLLTGQYWTINPNGATGYNVDLTLPDSVVEPYACRYTGSGWDCAASVDNGGSVTRQGVTAFSDWTVGNDVDPTAVGMGRVSSGRITPFYAIIALVALLLLLTFRVSRAR